VGVGTPDLPRELAPGIYWIGDCNRTLFNGTWTHSYQTPYVISGRDRSLIVDTGSAKDWRAIDRQLNDLEAAGIAPVEYLFPTHPEVAHASNLGRLLTRFTDSVVLGVVDDYHLVFPQFADRLVGTAVGAEIELGDRTLVTLDAVFRDIPSQWLYDHSGRVLFTGDGFAYKHHHDVDECGKCAEEIPELPIPELTALFAEAAFYWTRFCDIEPTISQLTDLFSTLEVDVVAPGHGCPILDPEATVPRVLEGLRLGQSVTRETLSRRISDHVATLYNRA
jgi:flavorubredoxin